MITILGLHIYDVAVALTDILLCLESLALAYLLFRQYTGESKLRRLTSGLFLCLAVSSLFGAIFHGFFPDKTATASGLIIWLITALSIGGAASLGLYIDGLILGGARLKKYISSIAALYALLFAGAILFFDYHFQMVLTFYLPPILLMLLIALKNYLSSHKKPWLYLTLGVLLSFAAAAIQYLRINLDPVYFNYNALYHLIQGAALFLIFVSFRLILKSSNEKI